MARPRSAGPRACCVLIATLALLSATAGAAAETEARSARSGAPAARGARDLPSAEQLAEIRRVVELVRESRDQLSPAKLAQLARQLRQLRARIDATAGDEGEQGESQSTEAASGVHQVRSLSGGFNNDIGAHTLDAKSTLFYDDVGKGVIEAPPAKGDGPKGEKANVSYDDEDYNFDFSDGNYGTTGASIAIGVSGGLNAFDGKTLTTSVRHEGKKRVIGIGTSHPVPYDVHSYGTPKPPGDGEPPYRVHPDISDSSTVSSSSHVEGDHDPFVDARHITGPLGGGGFGPPKGAVSSDDAFADSTTSRSFLEHQARGQLFHQHYIRGGPHSVVVPPGDAHGATVHVAPALGPHAGTLVVPGAPPHVETIVAPPAPASVSVHIGISGHEPVVGYTPPAHVSPEEHLSVERPRSGGKIIFPVGGPHHAEASYVAPPPDVHVTHVEEHVTSHKHAAPAHVSFGGSKHAEPHVTHVEEHVYEKHHGAAHPHGSDYHQPQSSHVEEYHETHTYSADDHSPTYSKPHDASQYGPPHVKHVPVPYVPQHVPHPQPVYVTHHKKRPGFFDNLLRPFTRLKSYLFGGGRGHAKPITYAAVETPHHNYYEYGAAVAYPKKCRCIESKSVLGVLVAGVAAAGLVAYVYALSTNNTSGFGRAVDGPDRAALARLMLQEACSLGADAEGMWNGTVWIGTGEEDGDEGEPDADGAGGKVVKDGGLAAKRRGTGAEEANQILLKTLSDVKRSKLTLTEQELQTLRPRVSRWLDESSKSAALSHQVVKKAEAGGSSSSITDSHHEAHRTKRTAALLDQDTLASGAFHMYAFDGMDIPMRHSPRDPGLPVQPQTRRPVFRPPEPRPFTPDLPEDHSPGGAHGTDPLNVFFNHDILDGLHVTDDPYGDNYRFSRRMDLVDDITASFDIDRSESNPLPSLADPTSSSGSSSSNSSLNISDNSSSSALKATRDLPAMGDLLSTAASLLPLVDLGPFQPLTKAFQAETSEDRSAERGGNRGNSYRKRMKNMFVGLRRFVTKG